MTGGFIVAEKILSIKILNMRFTLEHLILDRQNLQDAEVIKCSQHLDMLIDQYQNLVGDFNYQVQ